MNPDTQGTKIKFFFQKFLKILSLYYSSIINKNFD